MHTCASFSSLIGMPIVLVMMSSYQSRTAISTSRWTGRGAGVLAGLEVSSDYLDVRKLEIIYCANDFEALARYLKYRAGQALGKKSIVIIPDIQRATSLMDMNTFNVSATLNVFRLITRPTLCLPHATVSTFNQVPVPLNQAFGKYKNVDIRAVVLDKDNCFACPNSSEVHKPYEVGSYFSGCKACYVAQIEDSVDHA
jgi:hypothetical protein